jgi:L-ascorbate metabolism protein UlaG (beta-lactamase superfamily)
MKRILVCIAALALAGCAAQRPEPKLSGNIEVLWLGQAAFKITSPGGKVIVIDPWLTTNPKTPPQFKDLKNLGKVDVVLVTHGHFDHSANAAELARLNKVRLYAPPGLKDTLVAIGDLPAELGPGMNKSGIATPLGPDIKLHMVRAEHSSEYKWKNPATGKEESLPGGEPVGWIIELENGFRIYHMGDTGLFGDMRFIGEFYKPDLVLVPIGGNFTINAQLGGYAVREMIRPKFAIPMHYGTYPILAGKPEDFVKEVGGAAKVIVIQPGEKANF